VHDDGQGVDLVAVDEDIEFDQRAGLEVAELVSNEA